VNGRATPQPHRGARLACEWTCDAAAPSRARLASERSQAVSTPRTATSARDEVRGVAPKLIELSEKVLYADVWERPGLSKRDRSLITVAALIAMYRGDQLTGHLERALANGVTREEIGEVITHMAFYSGWPTAMTAGRIAKKVFEGAKS
jgi:4-carboxymuconolactone decarboxylase